MRKIIVDGHRNNVTNHEISQILTVCTRTFDFNNPKNTRRDVSRLEVSKKLVDLLEALGEDVIQYSDAFPSTWDIRFEK